MSRTCRLRRYPSKVAHKFSDGQLTLLDNQIDSYWYAVIIHGLWCQNCLYTGKPLLVYGGKPWDDIQFNNHYSCMHVLGKTTKFGGSHMQVREIADSIKTDKLMPIAPVWLHEYIHVGRRRRRRHDTDGHNLENRAERHKNKVKMRRVFVSGDDQFI